VLAAAEARATATPAAHDDVVCSCCGGKSLAAGYVAAEDAALLDEMSNRPAELVRVGKLDEAERAAQELLERFPGVHDGHDRLGMVYEAKGDKKMAAHAYRNVIEFVRQHQQDYDPAFADEFHRLVERLDPTPTS